MATAVLSPTEILAKHRIPTLDGWRGVAILLVLFDHIQASLLGGHARPWTETGQHGVTIFFVLSGFLITSNLLERQTSLRDFYLRRFFRLIPVAWTYLAGLLILDKFTGASITSFAEVRSCVLFYRNFLSGSTGGAGHFWSIAIEEQFYLVWPILLLLLGMRRCRWIAVAGAISCALYRWIFWAHYNHSLINDQTQVRADALLVGCILAILWQEGPVREAAARWSKLWAFPSFVILVFCIARFHHLTPLYECICIAGLIAATVSHPKLMFAKPLSFAPLKWLGTVSYSVYVWQQIFMNHWENLPLAVFLLCVVMPIFALSSYYFIERPCIRVGHRLLDSVLA
jgi:peptidoglycan/LPS O-acetylase OafA/YrhL